MDPAIKPDYKPDQLILNLNKKDIGKVHKLVNTRYFMR